MRNDGTVIHPNAAAGYRREAETYAEARPSYHPELVPRILDLCGSGPTVELGAGTGILTSQLVESGLHPVAVEPVDAMRARLAGALPTVPMVAGTAESTGLATDSVDTVIAGQCFHWFDHDRALTEIDRILRPGGHLVTAWNVRDETTPWVAAYTRLLDRYSDGTPRYRHMTWRRAIENDGRFELVEEWEARHPWSTTPDGVVARALSTSFIATLAPDEQDVIRDRLLDIVDDLGPRFPYPYRSELQIWRSSCTSGVRRVASPR